MRVSDTLDFHLTVVVVEHMWTSKQMYNDTGHVSQSKGLWILDLHMYLHTNTIKHTYMFYRYGHHTSRRTKPVPTLGEFNFKNLFDNVYYYVMYIVHD